MQDSSKLDLTAYFSQFAPAEDDLQKWLDWGWTPTPNSSQAGALDKSTAWLKQNQESVFLGAAALFLLALLMGGRRR